MKVMKMNRLKEIRESTGLTQADVGKKLGVTQNAISKYELEQRKLKVETAKKLSDVYGVSLNALLETDKQDQCWFCHTSKNNDAAKESLLEDDFCWVYLEKGEGLVVDIPDLQVSFSIPIKKCPKCGRDLGDDFGNE